MFIKAYKRQLEQLVENQGEDYDIANQSSLIIWMEKDTRRHLQLQVKG